MAKDQTIAHDVDDGDDAFRSYSLAAFLTICFLLHSASPEHVPSTQTEHIQSELNITPL